MGFQETAWFAHPLNEMSNRIICELIGADDASRERREIQDEDWTFVLRLTGYTDYIKLRANELVKAEFFRSIDGCKLERWPLPKREGNPERSGREIGEELLAKSRRAKGSRCC